MKEKGFHLYLGVVNYKVLLDEANRIDKVRIGIETYIGAIIVARMRLIEMY